MTERRIIAVLAGVLMLAATVVSGAASAGQPTVERFDIDRTRPDPALTTLCGVPVTVRVLGHVVLRTFPDDAPGPVELVTVNLAFTATAGDNHYRFRAAGANLIRIEPDGTAILMITGQDPFAFTGVLKIDLETGETILEPQHSLEELVEDACEALTV